MTAEMLLAAMLTWECHTMVVDVPERRETVVQTVCIKVIVEPDPPVAIKKKPAVKKPVKQRYASRKKKRRTARR